MNSFLKNATKKLVVDPDVEVETEKEAPAKNSAQKATKESKSANVKASSGSSSVKNVGRKKV